MKKLILGALILGFTTSSICAWTVSDSIRSSSSIEHYIYCDPGSTLVVQSTQRNYFVCESGEGFGNLYEAANCGCEYGLSRSYSRSSSSSSSDDGSFLGTAAKIVGGVLAIGVAAKVYENMQNNRDTSKSTKEDTKVVNVTSNSLPLFAKCKGCHGVNAEKKALGRSKVIAGWSQTRIKNALKGYKNGSYGGSMKGLMKGQATGLSDVDIANLASYISGLK